MDLQPDTLVTLSNTVYDLLRQDILNQRFHPGEQLDLKVLEVEFQVSRTPLKDALTLLQNEGLVDVQPRRGTFIAIVDSARLEENYKIRSALELYVSLCLFKYLEPSDFEFFDQIRERMQDLVSQANENWSNILDEYIQLDQAMHERFIIKGGTPQMLKLFQQMNVHTQMLSILPRYRHNELLAIHFEHEQLFDALFDQSPDRLNAVLLNHLEASRIRALKALESPQSIQS